MGKKTAVSVFPTSPNRLKRKLGGFRQTRNEIEKEAVHPYGQPLLIVMSSGEIGMERAGGYAGVRQPFSQGAGTVAHKGFGMLKNSESTYRTGFLLEKDFLKNERFFNSQLVYT